MATSFPALWSAILNTCIALLAPDYCPKSVGATGVYTEGGAEWTEVVTAVHDKGTMTFVVVGQAAPPARVHPVKMLVLVDRGLFCMERDGGGFGQPVRLMAVPEQRWSKWKSETAEYEVLGREWVTAPAGVFSALVIRSEPDPTPDLTRPVVALTETAWYAPGVGLVRRTLTVNGRSDIVTERVLKSFSPGGK